MASVVAHWTRVIRRRWRSGVATMLIVALVGLGVLFLTRPRYKAEARLRIGEPPPTPGVTATSGITSLLRPGGDPFSNDLELLDSRTVSEGMADDVALAVEFVAPRHYPRDSLVTALSTTHETAKARFAIAWEPDGAITVRETSPRDSLVVRGRAGAPLTFGGVTATFTPWHAGMPRSIEAKTQLYARAVRVTREDLDVDRARRDANVVDIGFRSTDPGVALGVVDAAVRHFIGLRTAVQRRESGETVDSLRDVAQRASANLAAAERRLEALERRTRLVAPDAQAQAAVNRASQLEADLAKSEAELAVLNRVLARVDTARDPSVAWAELLSYPRFLENGTMGSVLNQLVGRQQQRAELATRRTPENRDLRVLDEQIATLDSTLRTLVRGYRTALTQQVGLSRAELATLDSTLGAVPGASIELAQRQRDVKLLSDVVLMAQTRLNQEELREALTFANVQVIDPPALRDKPVWPPLAVGLGVLGVLALLSGIAAMVLGERADRTVHTLRDIRSSLGAPVLLAMRRPADGTPVAAKADVAALLLRAVPADRPAPHLALAGTHDNGATSETAAALVATGEFVTQRTAASNGARTLIVGGAVDQFPAAAAVAQAGGPVVLVVECGRTTRDELARAAELLRESGATLVGAIAIYRPGGAEARELWD